MLDIRKSVENDSATVCASGRIDTVTAPDFEKAIKEILPGVKSLTIDFANLEYVSSAGLRVLLSAQKVMNVQGSMKLVNVCEAVREIFDVTGFSDILTIE